MKLFTTPNAHEQPRGNDRFWKKFRRGFVGATVIKYVDGTYRTVVTPSESELQQPNVAIVYHGGHECFVSDQEAAALIAAGYTVKDV